MKHRLLVWLISRLIYLVHLTMILTVRWRYVGERYRPGCEPYILSLWHSRILMMPYAYRQWKGTMLVSSSRDGDYITEANRLMGVHSTRGSSRRGGARAMLAMIRLAREQGYSLGITPDGPKGPREEVKSGIYMMARKSGLPIRAASYATKRYWRANSWDRFYIPKPFTSGVFVIGEPYHVDPDDEEKSLAEIQRRMDEVNRLSERYFD